MSIENKMNRYNTLSAYFRRRFGVRVQKVPLDAGASCPNRDGTLSSGGCVFCNPAGSGSGMGGAGLSLEEQWALWRARYARSRNAALYIAYLQSFSNTYGSPERLREMLLQLRRLEGISGISVGTRPDCLDGPKLDLLADAGFDETWLELGVQSAHDDTLRRINRGHDAACSAAAIHGAAARGLRVCAHVIFGLPGECAEAMLDTVRWLNGLPVLGVKFHALYVCRGTTLAAQWRGGLYDPMSQSAYVDLMVEALTLLRSDIVVHRVVGEPSGDELLAPEWAADKRATMALVQQALATQGLWQGCRTDAPVRPLWYDNPAELTGRADADAAAYAALCERQPLYRPASNTSAP
ncbi:TIGR01212 family radical SAM protein [Nitratidesulfovibrio vulgaris]|uniref:TIGR01212 family radical SAM protein n=1 Tax=Nitratidesulfovibrio vulgaris TaxID=881 RepID=UPI0023006A89|nr:TIGR01212 family radical SAM protein [Nitratidesulfovibrio vulgaris]WCB46067.1 TIGR01212 family radical SAM protein [Nitratidesulfovibrio vulgaris]